MALAHWGPPRFSSGEMTGAGCGCAGASLLRAAGPSVALAGWRPRAATRRAFAARVRVGRCQFFIVAYLFVFSTTVLEPPLLHTDAKFIKFVPTLSCVFVCFLQAPSSRDSSATPEEINIKRPAVEFQSHTLGPEAPPGRGSNFLVITGMGGSIVKSSVTNCTVLLVLLNFSLCASRGDKCIS